MITAGTAPSSGAAPANASYVTTDAEATLTGETVYNTIAGALGAFEKATITATGEMPLPTSTFSVAVETYEGGATDDLESITGGAEGHIIVLKAFDDAHTVVVKSSSGNIYLEGDIDFSMDTTSHRIVLHCDGANWFELCRSNFA